MPEIPITQGGSGSGGGGGGGSQPVSPGVGLSRKQIIEIANKRTERKGKLLDLDAEFLDVLQDLCSRYRWFWRRKRFTFQTVAGTQSYDLTDSGIVTTPVLDFQKFLRNGVRLYTTPTDYSRLSPVFEENYQDDMLENPGTPQQPSQYFIVPGTLFTLAFNCPPDGVYTATGSYWAMPNMSQDSEQETVPLVPGYLHRLLIKGMEKQIFRYTIGEGSEKYITAAQEWEAGILNAQGSKDFADGRITEVRDLAHEDAIQSTGEGLYPNGFRRSQ